MTVTNSPIRYLLTILEEPNEDPIRLTQEDFDQLVQAGKSCNDTPSGNLIDFATLETVDSEDVFTFQGESISADDAGRLCSLGLQSALKAALDHRRNSL